MGCYSLKPLNISTLYSLKSFIKCGLGCYVDRYALSRFSRYLIFLANNRWSIWRQIRPDGGVRVKAKVYENLIGRIEDIVKSLDDVNSRNYKELTGDFPDFGGQEEYAFLAPLNSLEPKQYLDVFAFLYQKTANKNVTASADLSRLLKLLGPKGGTEWSDQLGSVPFYYSESENSFSPALDRENPINTIRALVAWTVYEIRENPGRFKTCQTVTPSGVLCGNLFWDRSTNKRGNHCQEKSCRKFYTNFRVRELRKKRKYGESQKAKKWRGNSHPSRH